MAAVKIGERSPVKHCFNFIMKFPELFFYVRSADSNHFFQNFKQRIQDRTNISSVLFKVKRFIKAVRTGATKDVFYDGKREHYNDNRIS